jgi:hypothetical protein
MATKRLYRLSEAARAADATEEELLQAIQDGLLRARLQQNTGEYAIDSDELALWVKRTRHADPLRQVKKKKVLLLGEDLSFAGTLKLELARNDRVDVRFASWGQDGILLVSHYDPDLYVVDLSRSLAAPDVVLAAVVSRRSQTGATVIATCQEPEEALGAHPLITSRLGSLSPEAFVSRAGGMRPLLVAVFAALGLETRTQIIKRQA